MPLKILGLNHNTAPVEIREQVVFSGDRAGSALKAVKAIAGVDEAVLLSTCNRTEFYVMADPAGHANLGDWLAKECDLDEQGRASLFDAHDDAAIRHIFRVACGLDSLVLGEPQILGQLKDAFREATHVGAVGSDLSRLMQHTFSVAKKVRTDTDIGVSPVSVAYAAVTLAQQFFAKFENYTALLIGAGATIELVAQHLHRKGIGRLFVANRSLARATELAHQFGGFALPLSELGGTLPEADILITATASTEPVVTAAAMQAAIKTRKHQPVFAVDIAVPRDIETAAGELDDVYLYTVDDLDRVIVEGQASRAAAAEEAERILHAEIERYLTIERSKQAAPIITTLRDQAEAQRSDILELARKRLQQGNDAEAVLEYATAALMKKMLHQPSVALREAGEKADEETLRSAATLFGIDKS